MFLGLTYHWFGNILLIYIYIYVCVCVCVCACVITPVGYIRRNLQQTHRSKHKLFLSYKLHEFWGNETKAMKCIRILLSNYWYWSMILLYLCFTDHRPRHWDSWYYCAPQFNAVVPICIHTGSGCLTTLFFNLGT